MTIRKLGRQPRAFNATVPALMQMVRAIPLAPIPDVKNWTDGMPFDLGMMLNGPTPGNPTAPQLGDCTCAAVYHGIQVWTFNVEGKMLTEPDACVEKLYEMADGYVPGDESTDNGGVEQNVLAYLVRSGAPMADGTVAKIAGFVEIDSRQIDDIKRGVAECGFVYIGVNLPSAWASAPIGMDLTDTSSPCEGGHAGIVVGYDANWAYVLWWGVVWRMSWDAFVRVCEEAYVLFSQYWVEAKGVTPFGITLAASESSMQTLKVN